MQIPEQIKKFANSSELGEMIESIGDKLGLHIDQMGELGAEIRDIMMGVSKSSDFSAHIKERLEVDDAKAKVIMEEVNVQIFDALKKKMQSEESKAVETAGQFSIEKENESVDTLPVGDKQSILSQIEDPLPNKEKLVEKKVETPHTEPLVDQLLSQPAQRPEQKTKIEPEPVKKEEPAAPKPVENKPKGPDQYREPIN